MEKYKILVSGIPVNVYPAADHEAEKNEMLRALNSGELAVVVHPGYDADFKIDCFDKNNKEPREPYVPLAALSCFFGRIRSYPDMSLSIAFSGKNYDLDIKSGEEYKFSVNSGKCKILCSNTVRYDDGVELTSHIVGPGDVAAAVLVEDADCFDAGRLALLLEGSAPRGVRSAVALSSSGSLSLKTAGDIHFFDALIIADHVLSHSKRRLNDGFYEATVNGEKHKFSKHRKELAFYPEIKYIS